MKFGLISIGTELLTGKTIDTNKWHIAQFLHREGYRLEAQMSVHDQEDEIKEAIDWMRQHCDFLLATGGLGETHDDITAKVFREHFPHHAEESVANLVGTALGVFLRGENSCAMIMPGPPAENQSMFPFIREKLPKRTHPQRFYHICGMREVDVEKTIGEHLPESMYATYVSTGFTSLCIESEDYDALVEELFGDKLFGKDQDTLEGVVHRLLKERDYRVAVAESVTGGMLGEYLSLESGSSDQFYGGYIVYRPEAKQELLGLSDSLLAEHGTVSAETTRALAQALKIQCSAEVAMAVTGYAESDDPKLHGKMHLCIITPQATLEKTVQFQSSRSRNRERLAIYSLNELRKMLLP